MRKLRSPYKQEPLSHLGDILALDATLTADDAPEHHLYFTDYRSRYVAHRADVRADDVRGDSTCAITTSASSSMAGWSISRSS